MLKILWKNKLGLAAGLVVILVIAYFVNHPTVEPKDCPLCGGIKYHAPCIADLSTGEIGELAIYAPHPVLTGEIAEEQPGGTLAFLPCAGLTAVQDMDGETCTIHLPGSSLKWNPALFCRPCRELLGKVSKRGYVLLDLYNLNSICAYPIKDGVEYRVRDYSIYIEYLEETSEFIIEERGNRKDRSQVEQ